MSETYTGWAPTSPADFSIVRHQLRTIIPSAAASAITSIAPDPNLPGPLGYIPFAGAAEGMVHFAGKAWDLAGALDEMLAQGLRQRGVPVPRLGVDTSSPSFVDTAGRH